MRLGEILLERRLISTEDLDRDLAERVEQARAPLGGLVQPVGRVPVPGAEQVVRPPERVPG